MGRKVRDGGTEDEPGLQILTGICAEPAFRKVGAGYGCGSNSAIRNAGWT